MRKPRRDQAEGAAHRLGLVVQEVEQKERDHDSPRRKLNVLVTKLNVRSEAGLQAPG